MSMNQWPDEALMGRDMSHVGVNDTVSITRE
jgi:hypothetical protein